MRPYLPKAEISRHLWGILEKTPKALKDLADNPAARSIRKAAFETMKNSLDALSNIEGLEEGHWYELCGYDDDRALLRLEGFRADTDDGSPAIVARIAYATAPRVYYKDMADTVTFSDESAQRFHAVPDPEPKELVTHVSEKFVGPLLGDLIQGTPLPQPQKEEQGKE